MTNSGPGWAPEYERRRRERRERERRRRRKVRAILVMAAAVLAGIGVGWALSRGGGAQGSADATTGGTATTTPDASTAAQDTTTASTTMTTVEKPPTSSTRTSAQAPSPALDVIVDPIPFSSARRSQAAEYSLRHYGVRTAALDPKVIVLHFTENSSYSATRNVFSSNTPAPGPAGSAAETPGTCAHYVVDQDGAVYQIVPPTVQCRHTIGLNRWAIGIELVQATHGNSPHWACQQILGRKPQIRAALALVRSLQSRYGIATSDVIGHATANESRHFLDLQGWRNDHSDWGSDDVDEFRSRL